MRLALAAAGHRIVYMSYVDSVGRCRVRRIYAALVHFSVVGLMRDDRCFLSYSASQCSGLTFDLVGGLFRGCCVCLVCWIKLWSRCVM